MAFAAVWLMAAAAMYLVYWGISERHFVAVLIYLAVVGAYLHLAGQEWERGSAARLRREVMGERTPVTEVLSLNAVGALIQIHGALLWFGLLAWLMGRMPFLLALVLSLSPVALIGVGIAVAVFVDRRRHPKKPPEPEQQT